MKMPVFDKVWKKTLEIYTYWNENKIVLQQKKVTSNGMTDDFLSAGCKIDNELDEKLNNWVKVRTQKFFLSALDDIFNVDRDGNPVGENSIKDGWKVTINDKRYIRDKFLDATNDLNRDFRCMLETVVHNPMIIILTPEMKKELSEHVAETEFSNKS